MKVSFVKLVGFLFALGLAALASAADTDSTGAIYQKTAADGSVELSNVADDTQAEPLVGQAPAAATPASEIAARSAAAPDASSNAAQEALALPEPIAWFGSVPPSQIKDRELANALTKAGATQLTSGNPAAGRRYLMIDRNTYMKLYGTQ